MKKRLAIITTHPIQYNAPLFKLLAQRGIIQVKVFYTWGETVLQNKYDPGFSKNIEWDIPLLEGYDYSFVLNTAKDKGSHHFNGINNPALIRDIELWKPDAILIYGWSFKSHLKALRYFNKKNLIFFRGDSNSLKKISFFKNKLRNLFLKWVYRHVDVAFYTGTHNRNYFLQHGLKKDQLVFVPHAIDNHRYAEKEIFFEEKARQWREKLGVKLNDILFLYAGKIDGNKNVQLLIDAFIKIEHPGAHLLIAGNGEDEKRLAGKYAVHSKIHFIPFQNQSVMPVLYRVCDVFVLPSLSETWGLVLNEAMACSKVVIASDACGASVDLISEGKNGYIFKSGNINDLENKMRLVVKNRHALKDMGMASFDIIKDWSYQSACAAIEKTILFTDV